MSAHHRPLDESDVVLIRTIRSTPSLYDHRHGDFRLSQRKEEDWIKVAKILNISSPDARRRWTCLRDRYSRELKQMRLHPSSEFGRNEFFRQMDFLREFVRKRRERSRRDDTPTGWLKSEIRTPRMMKVRAKPETLIEQDMDESQVYDDCDHNYDADAKLEVQTTHSESYSVLVEADDGDVDGDVDGDGDGDGEGDGDGHDSYEEYMADSESVDHKVLPTLQPSPALVTVHHHAEAPTTATVSTAGESPSDGDHSQAEIDYMVCLPNARVDREHLPATKQESSPPFEALITTTPTTATGGTYETEDDFFCKSVAAYLRQLSRRHKIKAKVEMYQILEKYILLEESSAPTPGSGHNG